MDGLARGQGLHERKRRALARGPCRKRGRCRLRQRTIGPYNRLLPRRNPARHRAPRHRKLMHVFEVLADPVRRRILEMLVRGELASGQVVSAIGAEFGITQAAVSQHLRVLRESGFARVRADAQRRLYSVDATSLQAVEAWVSQFRPVLGTQARRAGNRGGSGQTTTAGCTRGETEGEASVERRSYPVFPHHGLPHAPRRPVAARCSEKPAVSRPDRHLPRNTSPACPSRHRAPRPRAAGPSGSRSPARRWNTCG